MFPPLACFVLFGLIIINHDGMVECCLFLHSPVQSFDT